MTNPPENIIVEARDVIIVEARNVSFSYPEEPDRYVLNNLNLQVCRGECVAILGESGAGKTTLLKLLCGLLKPTHGQILFKGKPLQGPENDIALIFQNYGLFPWKTVRENILLPARLRKKGWTKTNWESCWTIWAFVSMPADSPRNCPAASCRELPWDGRS